MLEYDNSAFYYFALTLLIIFIIPSSYYALSEFYAAFLAKTEVGRTAEEKKKLKELNKVSRGWTRLNTTSYLVNLTLLLAACIIVIYLISLVRNHGQVSVFDPYSILGIEPGTPTSEIKKVYRRLSLKYHPDKNIGNKLAEEMFVKISKAYEALTDETARENFEKFGNPDGKQALEVSIGLPKLLLNNPKVVLVLYLIVMVLIIPIAVGYWYSNSKKYGEKNIFYETYENFYNLLAQHYRMKHLPEILACSAEYRDINKPKQSDIESMTKIYERLLGKESNKGQGTVMMKPKYEKPAIVRGNLLLHAHMMRLTNFLNDVSDFLFLLSFSSLPPLSLFSSLCSR
jgi:translocation protein SEC63